MHGEAVDKTEGGLLSQFLAPYPAAWNKLSVGTPSLQ